MLSEHKFIFSNANLTLAKLPDIVCIKQVEEKGTGAIDVLNDLQLMDS